MHRIHHRLVWAMSASATPWVPWWNYSWWSMSGQRLHEAMFLWALYLTGLAWLFPSHQGAATIISWVLSLPALAIPLSSFLERWGPLTTLPAQRLLRIYWIHHLVTTIKIPFLWFILVGEKKSFKFLEMQGRDDTCPIHFPDSNASCR